jgi:hypothetical protein
MIRTSVIFGCRFFLLAFAWAAADSHGARVVEKTRQLSLHSKRLTLDPKVWSYYAPGSLTPRGLLPLGDSDGLLIKNSRDAKSRRTVLIRAAPMVRDLKSTCNQARKGAARVELDGSGRECRLIETTDGRDRVTQWIYSDLRALKFVSLSFPYAMEHPEEAGSDLARIRTSLTGGRL